MEMMLNVDGDFFDDGSMDTSGMDLLEELPRWDLDELLTGCPETWQRVPVRSQHVFSCVQVCFFVCLVAGPAWTLGCVRAPGSPTAVGGVRSRCRADCVIRVVRGLLSR